MKNDNASDEVIGNTDLNAKDFVRFYFGTGTPTQFHNALDIYDGLLYLCVRSQAEKETLVHFLSQERREYLSDKILIRSNGLFEPYRFYVERVSLVNQQIKIVFSMPTRDKYLFKTTVINHDTGAKRERDTGCISLESKDVSIRLDPQYIGNNIEFRLEIDGHLAYAHIFTDDTIIV